MWRSRKVGVGHIWRLKWHDVCGVDLEGGSKEENGSKMTAIFWLEEQIGWWCHNCDQEEERINRLAVETKA